MSSIKREFEVHGSTDDQENLRFVLDGAKRAGWSGSGATLSSLVEHPDSRTAKLAIHHVLALRLYTTSSFARVNNPLRKDPPERPHPFAATTFFIDQGIKMLRAVAAMLPDAHETKTYWRGVKDLGVAGGRAEI